MDYGCLEGKTAYADNLIPGGKGVYEKKKVDNYMECRTHCEDADGCKFFTYLPGEKSCYLKSSDLGRKPENAKLSGSVGCRLSTGFNFCPAEKPFALWYGKYCHAVPCETVSFLTESSTAWKSCYTDRGGFKDWLKCAGGRCRTNMGVEKSARIP